MGLKTEPISIYSMWSKCTIFYCDKKFLAALSEIVQGRYIYFWPLNPHASYLMGS